MHFNWLPNSVRKNISEPKVVFEQFNNQKYSGYYDPMTATIVAVELDGIANILAHEHRHHQQWTLQQQVWPLKYVQPVFDFQNNYWQSIQKYFTQQPWEMDALLWSNKVAKTELTELWQELTPRENLVCS